MLISNWWPRTQEGRKPEHRAQWHLFGGFAPAVWNAHIATVHQVQKFRSPIHKAHCLWSTHPPSGRVTQVLNNWHCSWPLWQEISHTKWMASWIAQCAHLSVQSLQWTNNLKVKVCQECTEQITWRSKFAKCALNKQFEDQSMQSVLWKINLKIKVCQVCTEQIIWRSKYAKYAKFALRQ